MMGKKNKEGGIKGDREGNNEGERVEWRREGRGK